MNSKQKKLVGTILKNVLAWIISLIMLIPLALIVLNAFKPDHEALTMTLALPKEWTFANFAIVIEQGKLIRSFLNSLLYAGTATLIAVFLGYMAAYVFSRRRDRVTSNIYMYMVLGIVPVDLDEAAVIDGCGPFRLYFNIILPMLKSSMVTAAVLCFLNTWNEFVMPLYFLNSSEKWPMTLVVYNFFGQYSKSWNLICADILLTCLPVIIMYLVCQKYIVGGQTAGAVKG